MKKFKKIILYVFTCIMVIGGSVALAHAATSFPSETNAFVSNYYVEPINQKKPFFDSVLPEIAKNIKKNNKHSITPYYDAFPVANNPENFQGLGSTTYANINGKKVTAEAFYRLHNEGLNDPNNGMGLLIYQCIQYKLKHPEEDVKITFTSYRTSASAAVCVLPESKYYGYMRSLFGTNYDEHGFVRISYMLTEAARMGIEVTLVNQLNSYAKSQYNPATKSLKSRKPLDYVTYFEQALKSDCYDKYAPGKKVSDFMKFTKVGWNVTDKTADMQHIKSATVSHYLATDGKEHTSGVFFSSSNLDENDYRGANGNNSSQSGVIISDHDELYRVTYNFTQLMYEYRGKEDLFKLRKLVNQMNEEQMALIESGKGNQIPKDKQIIYLGTKNDPVFELYFTPFGGGADEWNTKMNPVAKYVDKLPKSTDYIEFIWNAAGYGNCNVGNTMSDVLEKAYCGKPNVNNKIAIRATGFDTEAISELALGTEIGYRSIKSGNNIHSKDILVSYKENGIRHRVSLMTSCNFYMIAWNYRTNSMLVIHETDKTGGNFYNIFAERYSYNMINNDLMVNPANLALEPGESYKVKANYSGSGKLTWSTSDSAVATVKNGKITAKNTGVATITVTDGKVKDTVEVTVVDCTDCLSNKDGITCNIDEQYVINKKLSTTPITFESVFTVKKDDLTGNTTILGSDGMYDPALVFSLNKSGNPRVMIRNTAHYSKQKEYVFKKVNVATGERVHLSIVMDFANKQMLCYVNGKLSQTITGVKKVSAFEEKHNLVIGGDHRNGNATYFKGTIESISVWSDVRTASEISSDYKNGIKATDSNLLASYDFTRCDKCMTEDLSPNGNNLEHVVLWQSKNSVKAVTDYEYSFAVIGDTQTMCENDPEAMESIYDWILANKKSQKIEYVIGLGDITDDSTDAEWKTANKSISKLNGKIPYVLARGNHDDWDDFNRNLHNGFYETTVDGMMTSGKIKLTDPNQPGVVKTTTNGKTTLVTGEGDTPEGGTVKGDLTNSYRYFTIQGTDYLIMTLDFAPGSKVLKWADKVIKAHPNHRVIIITHAYMYRDGTTLDSGDCYPPSYYKGYTDAQNGDDMWTKCFSKHKNVVMVLSGHDPWQHIVYRQDEGVNGNVVTQMLIDPQYMDSFIGSTAMVAMLYFSNDGNTVTVRYYSVEKDCYGSAQSQFTVNLNKHTHTYKKQVTDATFKKNGKIVSECTSCGYTKTSKIYYPKTISLSETVYGYDGKVKTPSVTVKDSKGKALENGEDYTVEYEEGRKKIGKYTVKVTFKGNYSGTKKLTFKIAPKKLSKIKVTQGTKTLTLKWSKSSGADGYRIYQYNSKTKKYKEIATTKKRTYKVKKLKAGTVYKFKIKAYTKTKKDGTIWSEASSVLKTATKPATVSVKSVTSTISKQAEVVWKPLTAATGYKIEYSTSKKFTKKTTKSTTVKSAKTKSKTLKKLKSGKKYYIRVRAYKTVNDKKIYGAWSKVKTVTVK